VLVGDTAQLPAFSRVQGENSSLMERLQAERRVRRAMLCIQYRMPAALCEIVSAHFYEGLLQTGKAPDCARAQPLHALDVDGVSSVAPKSTSRHNLIEAAAAVRQALLIATEAGVGTSVAILTPYAAQLALVQSLLSKSDAGDAAAIKAIEAMTVDASQGREWDHVIVSLVVSEPGRLGFVKDLRRQNVAMSRAKRTLTLVGSPSVARELPAWADFHSFAVQVEATDDDEAQTEAEEETEETEAEDETEEAEEETEETRPPGAAGGMASPFVVLGVETTSTDEEIKRAYRKLALRWHPDKNPGAKAEAEARFKEIGAAYEQVRSVEKRAK